MMIGIKRIIMCKSAFELKLRYASNDVLCGIPH